MIVVYLIGGPFDMTKRAMNWRQPERTLSMAVVETLTPSAHVLAQDAYHQQLQFHHEVYEIVGPLRNSPNTYVYEYSPRKW